MADSGAREFVGAVGAGRMGRGIAHAFAYAGHDVLLLDLKQRSAEQTARLEREALAEIDANLRGLVEAGLFEDAQRPRVLRRIEFVAHDAAPEALSRIDVAFEGVPERFDAKREALALCAAHMRTDAVIASTTSTFLSTTLAEFVGGRERFLNAHWLNPAYLIPLVELMPHPGTAPQALERARALLESIGKVPVVCASVPGYIVPRLQSLVMNEAARMIEQGVATAEEIDKATRYGFGIRYAAMGVVEFIDYGGNDILFYASRYLADALEDPRYGSPEIVDRYMAEGRNGMRSGRGFYDWDNIDLDRYRLESLKRLLSQLREQGLIRPPAD